MKRIITAVAAIALSASFAYASPRDPRAKRLEVRRAAHHLRAARIAQHLDLTIAQKQEIRQIRRSFREQNHEFLQSFRENRIVMREARRANDGARVTALEPTLREQRTRARELRQARRQSVRAVLTPEQREKLDTIRVRPRR